MKTSFSRWRLRMVRMAALIVMLGLQLTCERARADDLLRGLMVSRSVDEIESRVAGARAQAMKTLACRMQLKRKRMPLSCFELHGMSRTKLDALCLSAVESSRDFDELEKASRHSAIGDRCRRSARERKEDLAYQDEMPERRVFEWIRSADILDRNLNARPSLRDANVERRSESELR